MPMVYEPFEERILALEEEMRQVKALLKRIGETPQRPWWERLAGTFKDDPLFAQVIEAGHQYRQSLKPRSQ